MPEEPSAEEEPVFRLALARDAVAGLRADLAAAESPDEQLEILAELTGVSAELCAAGDEAAALAGECLDEAITGLTRVQAAFPAASGDGLLASYLLAQASLLRDVGSDLDDAICYLRDLRGLLPPDDPDLGQVELELAQALIERCSRSGQFADLDEIVATLTDVLRRMDRDDSRRATVLSTLALYRAARYAGLNGLADDRDAALFHAAEGLTAAGSTAETTAVFHIVTAWMTLIRQLDSAHRSVGLNPAQLDVARTGGPGATELLAAMANTSIDADDAQAALSHLSQAREAAELDDDLRETAVVMACLATLSLLRAGRFTGDVTGLADELQQMALRPPVDLYRSELLGMRAGLIAAQSDRDSAGPEPEHGSDPQAADALQEAATQLPPHHLLRSPLLEQLRRTFGRQVGAAGAAGDPAAEVDQLMDALERLPPSDPEFARTLTVIAIDVLQVRLSRRGAVPMSRLGARLEQAVAKLPPDDPLRTVGEAMVLSIVFVRGVAEHQPELSRQAIEGLIRNAENTPADNPFRPYAYMGLASAFADQYTMTGELRLLEQSRIYLEKGIALHDAARPSPEREQGRAMLFYLRGMGELFRLMDAPESADFSQAISDLQQAADLVPPDHPLCPRIIADLESVRIARQALAAEDPVPKMGRSERAAAETVLATVQGLRRDHPDFPSLAAQAAAVLMMQGVADLDPKPMDRAIALLADACTVPGLMFRERPRVLDALGFGLLTRYNLTRQPRDLSNAIDRLEEARRAVEQESASPYAANVLRSLASAYRIRGDAARGDVDRAVTIGLAALREHAGDVLLQDTDEHALSTARRMITDAVEMARWSLGRSRPGEAIDALELGRGTVLHAATAGAGLADILRAGGYHDLAAEWGREPRPAQALDTGAGSDLRYRIMTAIEGSPAAGTAPASGHHRIASAARHRRPGLPVATGFGQPGTGHHRVPV